MKYDVSVELTHKYGAETKEKADLVKKISTVLRKFVIKPGTLTFKDMVGYKEIFMRDGETMGVISFSEMNRKLYIRIQSSGFILIINEPTNTFLVGKTYSGTNEIQDGYYEISFDGKETHCDFYDKESLDYLSKQTKGKLQSFSSYEFGSMGIIPDEVRPINADFNGNLVEFANNIVDSIDSYVSKYGKLSAHLK